MLKSQIYYTHKQTENKKENKLKKLIKNSYNNPTSTVQCTLDQHGRLYESLNSFINSRIP